MRVWHDVDRSNTEAGAGGEGSFNGHKTFYGDLDSDNIQREKHKYYKGNLYGTVERDLNGTTVQVLDYNLTRHRQ